MNNIKPFRADRFTLFA